MASNIQQHALRRLQNERKKIPKDGVDIGFFATIRNETDILTWDVFIRGSKHSVYDGIVLHAEMVFPIDYPMNPPKMKFLSPMHHPNIYKDGSVCISILHKAGDDPTGYEPANERWSPVQCIRTIVLSVIVILNEPNTDSPADIDAAKERNKNKDDYEQKVREMAKLNHLEYADVISKCKMISDEEKEIIKVCLYKKIE